VVGVNNLTLAQLPQAPTLTILGNNTGSTAAPLYLTVAQTKALLGLPTGNISGTNQQIPVFDSSGDLTGTSALLYNSSTNTTTGTGSFSFSSGCQVNTNFRITTIANNPCIILGDTAGTVNPLVGYASGTGSYFSDAVAGDMVLRNSTFTTSKILLGSGGEAGSAMWVNASTVQTNNVLNAVGGAKFATTGGTASTLTYYEDSVSEAQTISGPFSSSITISVSRIGNIVTIVIPTVTTTATASAIATFSANLATRFCPSYNAGFTMPVFKGASYNLGLVAISSSGAIAIAGDSVGGKFQNGLQGGWPATTISYHI